VDSSQSLGVRVPIPRKRKGRRPSYGLRLWGGKRDGQKKTKENWKGRKDGIIPPPPLSLSHAPLTILWRHAPCIAYSFLPWRRSFHAPAALGVLPRSHKPTPQPQLSLPHHHHNPHPIANGSLYHLAITTISSSSARTKPRAKRFFLLHNIPRSCL
jgi:hypothetical protein